MEIYDSAGVDLTAIRYMLSFTPAERIAILGDFVEFVTETRRRNGLEPIPGDPAHAR
jgi:hypothetical protein